MSTCTVHMQGHTDNIINVHCRKLNCRKYYLQHNSE